MGIKEILSRIKQIDGELSKRESEVRLTFYNKDKVHLKQMAFHKTNKKIRFVFGGNRSGKTECGAVEAIWRARGIHPFVENRPNVAGWVVSVTYEVQRDVAQKKILSYLPKSWIHEIVMSSGKKGSPEHGIIDHIIIKNVFGGLSSIGFKSLDQGRERFQGASLDFVWFDEEPDKDIYEECVMRVLDRCGDVWCTMTPLKGLTWVHEDIYMSNDPDVWYTTMDWSDNPYLDKNETERLERLLSREELETRKSGKFKASSGLVYPDFDEEVHVIEPFDVPREWYDEVSIDPGLHNPLSAHFYAVDYDGNIYVIAEHYEAERDIDYHATRILEIARNLGWKTDERGRIRALIDSAATQKTLASAKSVADLFYEKGILVNTKVDKDMWSGVARVRSLFHLRPARIFIFKTCPNLIREIKSYRYADGDRPKKCDDHALDELRYYVMSKPRQKEEKKVSYDSPIAKDKRRLLREINRTRGGRKS